jgi:hypothetical protein
MGEYALPQIGRSNRVVGAQLGAPSLLLLAPLVCGGRGLFSAPYLACYTDVCGKSVWRSYGRSVRKYAVKYNVISHGHYAPRPLCASGIQQTYTVPIILVQL